MGNRSSPAAPWRSCVRSARLLCLVAILGTGGVQAAPLQEAEFKAATLSKIIAYVSWPRVDGPLVVGLYGKDPFGGRLQRLLRGQRTKEGRPIQIRVINDAGEIPECQVLFVPAPRSREWARLSRGVPRPGQLTVGETAEFVTTMGGVCNLVHPEQRLEINRGNARKADLKISSRLLKIATLVDR